MGKLLILLLCILLCGCEDTSLEKRPNNGDRIFIHYWSSDTESKTEGRIEVKSVWMDTPYSLDKKDFVNSVKYRKLDGSLGKLNDNESFQIRVYRGGYNGKIFPY
jgi:hypothetical protein